MYHDKSNISLVARSAQQQKNGADYGLFSIAFSSALAFGGDPSTVTYDVALLRAYLIKGFGNNLMVALSVTEKCKYFRFIVEQYCVCCMPYWRTDKIGTRMAECECCKR